MRTLRHFVERPTDPVVEADHFGDYAFDFHDHREAVRLNLHLA